MSYYSPAPASNGNGRADNEGNDTPDILVPPLLASSSRNSNGNNGATGGQGGKESSDSRKWKLWKPSSSNSNSQGYKVHEIQAGPITSCEANDNLYSMNHSKRGTCIILNHTKYDQSQGLATRTGSDVDVACIQSTFSRLGFKLVTYHDLKYDQIMFNLTLAANEDHSQNDCLVVFVLTHGQANQLHAYDVTYKPSSLWSMFTANQCSTLAGKPKMFFIQACRGEQYDDGTELRYKSSRTQVDGPAGSKDDGSYRIPNQADFLTVFSTYEGFYSWRNSRNGSCFIRSLCKVLDEHSSQKDVLSMLTLVNRDVAISYESHSKEQAQDRKKQIPHVCHTLMRDIYLIPRFQFQSTLV